MSPRSTVAALAAVGIVAALLTLGIQASAQESGQEPRPQVASVAWDFRPESVDALLGRTDAVVYGEVAAVRSGAPLRADAEGHPDGGEIPTQRISIDVVDRILGLPLLQRLEVFKTGSADLHLEGDPPYRVGERYLLFLHERDDAPGLYIPAAPDGRLLEGGDGRLSPLIEGAVGRELGGKTVAEATNLIDRLPLP